MAGSSGIASQTGVSQAPRHRRRLGGGVLGAQRPARRAPTFAAATRLPAPGAEIPTASLAGSQRRALPGNDARPQASGVLQVSSARHRVAWPTAPRPCPSSPDRHLRRWGCWLHCSGTQPANRDWPFCLPRPTNVGGSCSLFIIAPSACVSDVSLVVAYLAPE